MANNETNYYINYIAEIISLIFNWKKIKEISEGRFTQSLSINSVDSHVKA
jgi:hypothetical protein